MNSINKNYKAIHQKYRWNDVNINLYNKFSKKLQGALISKGKKLKALNRYNLLNILIKSREKMEPYKVLFLSYMKILPLLDFRLKKKAGIPLMLPYGLMKEKKRITYAVKWLVKLQREKNKTKNLSIDRTADLLILASKGRGELITYKRQWQQTLLSNADFIKLIRSGSNKNKP